MMKRLLIIWGLVMAVGVAGVSLSLLKASQATVSIEPNVNFGACATNFTRLAPNYCKKNISALIGQGITLDGLCHTMGGNFSFPPTAVMVEVRWDVDFRTVATVANRGIGGNFYNLTPANCTGVPISSGLSMQSKQEVSATAGATYFLYIGNAGTFPTLLGQTTLNYAFGHTVCPQCGVSFFVTGYYD